MNSNIGKTLECPRTSFVKAVKRIAEVVGASARPCSGRPSAAITPENQQNAECGYSESSPLRTKTGK